jgi:hypothetical protein
MTGLHATHMLIGFGLLSVITLDGGTWALLSRLVHAGGDERPVLALRRHRVDLPRSRCCIWWTGPTTSPEPPWQDTFLPKSTYYAIFLGLMVLTVVTIYVAYQPLGSWNFPVGHQHRDHQGDARHPVLHAREVQ